MYLLNNFLLSQNVLSESIILSGICPGALISSDEDINEDTDMEKEDDPDFVPGSGKHDDDHVSELYQIFLIRTV